MNTTTTTLNTELYEAARKARMADALYAAQVEVIRIAAGFRVTYEREVEERGVEIDYSAIKRAEAWLAKRLARG